MKRNSGFTTIELIIALAIAVILITYAVGPIRNLLLRMQVSDQVSQIQLDFSYARNEAISRAYPVTLLPNEAWSKGWILFEDKNGDGILGDNEEQLRETPNLDEKITLTDSGEQAPVTFTRFGNLQNPLERLINLSHSEINYRKQFVISPSGSMSIRTYRGE